MMWRLLLCIACACAISGCIAVVFRLSASAQVLVGAPIGVIGACMGIAWNERVRTERVYQKLAEAKALLDERFGKGRT